MLEVSDARLRFAFWVTMNLLVFQTEIATIAVYQPRGFILSTYAAPSGD